MKKALPILLCLLFFIESAVAQTDSVLAKEFVQLNADGQFGKAQQYFAPALHSRISSGMLQTIWKRYMRKYGNYKGIEKMSLISRDSLRTWMTRCTFEKASIRLALTFNLEKQLVGYHITGIQPKREKPTRDNETDTTIATPDGMIAGTILLPKKRQKDIPVVLIIPGSGPVNRDGNARPALLGNTYKMLADSLAAHGIASFRYDKRGVGESSGLATAESEIRFPDFVEDATAIARFLKQDSLFSDVIIAGHSQGALVGMLVAQQVDVGGFISLEGAGEPIAKILYWQLSRKKSKVQKQQLKKIIDSLQAGQKVKNYKNYPLFRPSAQPLLISWMQLNPAEEIQKLLMPVLIINGTTDLQVTAAQAQKLANAAPTARVRIINGMNHMLKTAPEERTINLATYHKPDLPLNKELVVAVVSFIVSL